jgi:hypothetical protein
MLPTFSTEVIESTIIFHLYFYTVMKIVPYNFYAVFMEAGT